MSFLLALQIDLSAELLSWRRRSLSACRPIVIAVSSESIKQIDAKFWEKLPVRCISRSFFIFIFQNLFFLFRLSSVFIYMGPYGSKNFIRHL